MIFDDPLGRQSEPLSHTNIVVDAGLKDLCTTG